SQAREDVNERSAHNRCGTSPLAVKTKSVWRFWSAKITAGGPIAKLPELWGLDPASERPWSPSGLLLGSLPVARGPASMASSPSARRTATPGMGAPGRQPAGDARPPGSTRPHDHPLRGVFSGRPHRVRLLGKFPAICRCFVAPECYTGVVGTPPRR